MKKWDWMIVIATVLAPMTGFRIWKLGPAELLAFLWSIGNYRCFMRVSRRNVLIKFWTSFLVFSLFGAIICRIWYPDEGGFSDLVTWIYMAVISLAVYSSFEKKTLSEIVTIIERIAKASFVVYIPLYMYAKTSRTFLGAPLWLGYRFTGGADNPHQVALLQGVMVITGAWICLENKAIPKKLEGAAVCAGSMFLVLKTASSTALLAVTVGLSIMLFESWVRKQHNKNAVRIGMCAIIAAFAILFLPIIIDRFYGWIASDANGLGRLSIFSSYPITFWKSPFFGLGPGMHARDGAIEFHNMYLEILAMSGVMGGLVFLIFTKNVIKQIKGSTYALGVVSTIYAFGLAGFSMRRLVFWIVLGIVCAYSKRLGGNEKN